MIDDPHSKALTVPGAVARVAEAAADAGWAYAITFADGPPPSVALRLSRGADRAYGLWLLVDDRAKWTGGGTNRIPGGHLRTLGQLKAYTAQEAHDAAA